MITESAGPERSAPTLARLLVVLVPTMLLIPIASDMVSLVLPRIIEDFTVSTGQAAWVVTGFLLACAVGIPIYGRLADQVVLRRLFVTALAVYAGGSVLCAVAPSLPVLVAGRVLSGAGGAAIPVLTIVAASILLPPRQAALGVGLIAAAGGAGAALGPAIGGGLGQWLGWRSLFWLMTIVATLLIPAIGRVVPANRPSGSGRLDLLGGLLVGGGVGLVLFGVTRAEGPGGFSSRGAWISLLLGAVALAGVAARSAVLKDPFVPLDLIRQRGYGAALLVIFLAMLANLTALVLVPLLVIEVNRLTPGQGSLVMIPGGIALALASAAAGRVGSHRPHQATGIILGICAISVAMLCLSSSAGSSPRRVTVAVAVLGAGFGLVVTFATNVVSQRLPAELIGNGIGLFQCAQFIGAGVGPALFGVLLTLRRDGGGVPLNPLAAVSGAAYSDVFLILAVVVLLAIPPALRLRRG